MCPLVGEGKNLILNLRMHNSVEARVGARFSFEGEAMRAGLLPKCSSRVCRFMVCEEIVT